MESEKYLTILKKHHLLSDIGRINSPFRRNPEVFTDGKLIYKFSFTKKKIIDSKKQYEILKSLEGRLTTFKIPEAIYFYPNKRYSLLVYKAIKGELLDWGDFNKFSAKEINGFSEHLGEAICELHRELNSLKINNIVYEEHDETEKSFCDYLIRRIYKKDMGIGDKRFCSDLVKDNSELFKKVDDDKNQIMIHNDINIQNIIITDKKMHGIFDFDNSEYSQPYCEFRFFFFHNENSANIAYKKYLENNGRDYDKESLFLVGLTAGLSGVVHRKDYHEALSKLKNYVKRFDKSGIPH